MHALGLRSRRPRQDLTPRQDLAAVAAAKQVLDGLQKTAAQPQRPAADRLHLVYVDDCDVHAHPYLAKVWRRKGQVLKVPAAGDDHKFTVFGAVDFRQWTGRLADVRVQRRDRVHGLPRPLG